MVSVQDMFQSSEWFWGALAPKSSPPQSANHLAAAIGAFGDGEAEFIQNHLLWTTGIAEANPPELDTLHIQQVFRRVVIFKAWCHGWMWWPQDTGGIYNG